MKRLIFLLTVTLFSSFVMAHADHNQSFSQNQTETVDQQAVEKEGSNQVHLVFRSGTVSAVAGFLVALSAIGLAIRHHVRKSEYRSLKEFIREGIL